MSSSTQRWMMNGTSTVLLVDDDPFQAQARKSTLERRFASVERVEDAALAFIRVAQLQEAPSLIIVALEQPGFAGPAFVGELARRIPGTPILVLGRCGEHSHDYSGDCVRFLTRPSSTEAMLALSCEMLLPARPHVA